MTVGILGSELGVQLASLAAAHGLTVTSTDQRSLSATQEAIKSKWMLGGRKVVYHVACEVDEASRTVRFRESAVESSWGIPPPSITVEKTTQHGSKVTETRVDRGIGGGGRLDYGDVRRAVEEATRAAGWQFVFEVWRTP